MKRLKRKTKYCSKTPIAFFEIMVYSIGVVRLADKWVTTREYS